MERPPRQPTAGREAEARATLAPLLAAHPEWAELLARLPEAGLLPREVAERLLGPASP